MDIGGGNAQAIANAAKLTGWRDLSVAIVAAKTTNAAFPTWEIWKGGLWAWSFEQNSDNEIVLPAFHFDHDYKIGSAVYPHVHWAPSSANAGTVRFGFEWVVARSHNQEAFGTPQFTYIEQAAPGIVDQHMVAEAPDPGITIPNLEPDTLVYARMFRDADHVNDTYPDKVWVLAVDAHYQCDRLATINRAPDFYGG